MPSSNLGASDASWTPVSDARFSAVVPTGCAASELDEQTPYGRAHTHKWKTGDDSPRLCYIFRYTDLPAGAEYKDPQPLFDAMVRMTGAAEGSKVTGTRPLSLNGVHGWQVESDHGGMELIEQLYITHTRSYALIRVAPKGVPTGNDPFFKSFRIDAR